MASFGPSKKNSVSVSRLRGVRVSPQKARLIINLIRGQGVGRALGILRFQKQKTARLAEKMIWSAIGNAANRVNADVDQLYISEAFVDGGTSLKRSMPRARGRAYPIRKRYSHITLALASLEK